jgi:hypothetical protein
LTTLGLACRAAPLLLLLACSGSQPGAAKDGGGGDAGESDAPAAADDSGCGTNINFMNDPDNCGGCGIRCCVRACMQGACFCDGAGLTCCATDRRGPDGCTIQNVPANLTTDSCHCGGCGIACSAGTACWNATCVAVDGGAGCQ